MGQVWQATDTQLGRQVALKILPDAFADDPDRLARFTREAQILASLNHPNIAAIYGIEEAPSTGSGQASTRALVLELVEDPTLADRIAQGGIPIEDVLPIAKQIAEALEAAHDAGVIHRDLKPANIKVREDGTVKVLDFGLAKAFQPDGASDPAESPTVTTAAATRAGVILGTAAYMSPEQASGKPVDKRSDIWAFGAVLFEMLTGTRPFQGETVAHVVAGVLNSEPDWGALPAETPVAIQTLLRRCLAKERRRRVPDIGMARFEIDDAITAPDTDGTNTNAVAAPPLRVWQRAMPLAAGILALLVITGVGVWRITLSSPPLVLGVARMLLSLAPAGRIPPANTAANMAISRDGGWFAFRGTETLGGESRLYLRNVAEDEARAIPGTEGATQPFFSPDGRWVGFFHDGQLKKVSVTGGSPITLCAAPGSRGASWGENGMIVLASPSREALSQVSEQGGTPELLTEFDASRGETSHRQPHLLPGGEAVLFKTEGTGRGESEIWVQSLTTGARRRLVEDAQFPTFSLTGHLVYMQDGNLIAAPFDPDRLELLGPAVTVVDGSGGAVQQFALSDTGSLVYATGQATVTSLVWVDRETGVAQPLAAPPRRYFHAHLSHRMRRRYWSMVWEWPSSTSRPACSSHWTLTATGPSGHRTGLA